MKPRILLGGLGALFVLNPVFSSPEQGASLITNAVLSLNPALIQPKTKSDSKEGRVKTFCETALHPEIREGFSSEVESYESQQSLFLYLLCNNNTLEHKDFNETIKNYLKPVSFKTLKFTSQCQKHYLEKCNIAQLTDEIMTQLFSELFTLKQAELMGLTQSTIKDEELLNKKINAYAQEKFEITKFCDNNDHKYEKTCNLMKKQMKAFVPRIQQFKLLSGDALYEAVKDKDPKQTLPACIYGETYDLILCGTLGESNNGLKPFINLLYNELARYTMFTTYYGQMLAQENTVDFAIVDEMTHLKASQQKFLLLTNQTLEDLVTIAMTYPIHVGFLAYQEDLLRFRDVALSKTITPFYSLYHKLRNVQSND